MKALSIRQPWAWAVTLGWKRFENRDWKPNNPGRRFRGPVLIHAGLREETDALDFVMATIAGQSGVPAAEVLAAYRAAPRLGGIVGHGVITNVLVGRQIEHEADAGDPWIFGPVALRIERAVAFDLIRCKDALGFFSAPPDIVRRYLGASHLEPSLGRPGAA